MYPGEYNQDVPARVADPARVDPDPNGVELDPDPGGVDPDPTFKKTRSSKTGPGPTLIESSHSSFFPKRPTFLHT